MGLFRRRLSGEGGTGLRLFWSFVLKYRATEPPKKKVTYVRVDFFYEHKAKAREPRTSNGHQNPSPWQWYSAC
jgi:hypothetical protein